jgi:hypothetical protein
LSVSQSPVDAGRSRVPSLALSKTEAAQALGVSFDFFAEYVFPDLLVIRKGRRVLIPVRELELWLDRNAARTLEGAT